MEPQAVTELTNAILDGDMARIRALIRDNASLVTEASNSGTLPLDLARRKGLVEAEVALVVAGAPSELAAPPLPQLLEDLLSELSQGYSCAGWLTGVEYLVWTSVVGDGGDLADRDPFGLSRLDHELAADLKQLALRAGGWPCWDDGVPERTFLSMETWLRRYDQWRAAGASDGART